MPLPFEDLVRCRPTLPCSTPLEWTAACTRAARSATSSTSATSCCWSRPIASRPSTTCLASGIPDKGRVLTQLSVFWFERTRRHRRQSPDRHRSRRFPGGMRGRTRPSCAGRSMLVRKTQPIPIECVARGYLSGSGWKEYKATGAGLRHPAPAGLRESDRLPEPIFTPATKASSGHDINISEQEAADLIGAELVATAARADAGAVRASAPAMPSRAASSSPTRSSNSACCRPAN